MGELIWKPLIEDMRWSYSRITSFENCPQQFFLRYLMGEMEDERYYSSFGTLVHSILEEFYKGELRKDQLVTTFLTRYPFSVRGARPAASTVSKYIESTVNYLKSFEPFLYNMVAVEKRVDFSIGGHNFVGFVDYVGEKNDEIVIVDNKSRDLSPRKPGKRTKNDEALDEIYRQMYLYSIPVEEEYGKPPKELAINAYRVGRFIVEPFDKAKQDEAKAWAVSKIEEIENAEDFDGKPEWFRCNWICGFTDRCEDYQYAKETGWL